MSEDESKRSGGSVGRYFCKSSAPAVSFCTSALTISLILQSMLSRLLFQLTVVIEYYIRKAKVIPAMQYLWGGSTPVEESLVQI